ncbi:efflux RND transporter periplasmic adaptor subunit [Candidatus Binatia bacterium]|nr:efflux RND transporter periplasmic adaptor subunit [Candidatus Binatia bacterium]
MPRRRFWLAVTAALVGLALLGRWWLGGSSEPRTYVTAAVEKGPIVATVTATGTVNPVKSVTVGTYVSGPIQDIVVDYNSPVRKGQVIAKIDPRTYQGKVDQARAALSTATAGVEKARADAKLRRLQEARQEALAKTRVVSRDELDVSRSTAEQADAQLKLAEAAVEQAEASLREAQVNLGYTDIVSPVDGIVVSRDVQVGQTVAASFQTPTLFVIAENLKKMQVNAFVSEADIGRVREGQRATFSVDAYPGRSFPATVLQVRNSPQSVENVVTYDVVLEFDNEEQLLKPGMTANVSIVTAEERDVLKVPTAALRFQPPSADGASTRPPEAARSATSTDAARNDAVWVLSNDEPKRVPVTPGLSDETMVAVSSSELMPGDRVITRVQSGEQKPEGWSMFPRPGGGSSRPRR